jgi:hypothetical protein
VPQPIEGAAAAGATPQPVQTVAAGPSGPAPSQGMVMAAVQPALAPGAVQHPCSATQFVDLTAEKPAAVMQPRTCSESGHTAAGGVRTADGALKRASSAAGGKQQVPDRLLFDFSIFIRRQCRLSTLGTIMRATHIRCCMLH